MDPNETALADQPTEAQEQAAVVSDFPPMEEVSAEGGETEQRAGKAAGAEAEAESTYTLPDEQAKVFPDDVLQEFAENRYPELAKLLADENLPEQSRKQVRQILHDKLNGDIYIQKLKESGEEGDEEEVEETPEKPPEVDPAKTQQEAELRLSAFVDQITDPQVAIKFTEDFTKAFEIKDPQQRALAVTKTLTKGMLNVLREAIPAFIGGQNGYLERQVKAFMDTNYEGFGDTYKSNAYQSTWEGIRASNPKFAQLPAYNSPEWIAAAQEAAAIVPGFENAVYTDPATGKPLSPIKNFQKKAEAMANILTRTRGTAVKEAVEAVETGKRLAQESAQRKNLSKLGAGQSKGQIAASRGTDPLKAAIAAHRADSDPFAALKQKQ
jgi:hypothetical protein